MRLLAHLPSRLPLSEICSCFCQNWYRLSCLRHEYGSARNHDSASLGDRVVFPINVDVVTDYCPVWNLDSGINDGPTNARMFPDGHIGKDYRVFYFTIAMH